jgi:glycosyltransferase involved in cell wall biosynthesis
MELSVILPVYNEGKIILRNLINVQRYLQNLNLEYEIIVVNDGSTDDTLEQISSISEKSIHIISYPQNQGKGFAINRGMAVACGRYRLFMDMDLSTELSEIPKFLQHIRKGTCDVCIGNRNTVSLFNQKRPWYRAFMGKIFAALSSLLIGYKLDDYTCGFKIFTAQSCKEIFSRQQIYNWAFDSELIAIAHQIGLRVHQKPVVWHHYDGSKVRIVQNICISSVSLLKIWFWAHSKKYLRPV